MALNFKILILVLPLLVFAGYKEDLQLALNSCVECEDGEFDHLDAIDNARRILLKIEGELRGRIKNVYYILELKRTLIPEFQRAEILVAKKAEKAKELYAKLDKKFWQFDLNSLENFYKEYKEIFFEASKYNFNLLIDDNKFYTLIKGIELVLSGFVNLARLEDKRKLDLVKKFYKDLPHDLIAKIQARLGIDFEEDL